MQTFVAVWEMAYFAAALAGLAAVTAILYRLRFGAAVVLAPAAMAVAATAAFCWLGAAATSGLPFSLYSLRAAASPALWLATSISVVAIALSRRLSNRTAIDRS